jgi:thymidylate synthase
MRPGSYAHQYRALLAAAMHQRPSLNTRTGTRVRTLPGNSGWLKLRVRGRLPLPGNRRAYPHLAAAETAWQVSGERDASFVLRHAPKLWSKFVDASGEVPTAYGHRMRRHFGRDQLSLAVSALADDPSSRQVHVALWDPRRDGLGAAGPASVPCPVSFSASRAEPSGGLALTVDVRSSDMFVGLPYDVMNFALLGDALAATLRQGHAGWENCQLEWLTLSLAHGHVYEPQWDAARTSLDAGHYWQDREYECWPLLPGWSLGDVGADPEDYVRQSRLLAAAVESHPWAHSAEVVA